MVAGSLKLFKVLTPDQEVELDKLVSKIQKLFPDMFTFKINLLVVLTKLERGNNDYLNMWFQH